MLVNKSLDQMLKEIEFTKWIKYDILNPEENPQLFEEVVLNDDSISTIPHPKYIRNLSKLVNGGMPIALEEIFLNAFDWGNKKQKYLPISIKVFKGKKGYVMRIRDSGKGFNYKSKIKKMKRRQKYFRRSGYGLYWLESQYKGQISYEGKGSVINILIKRSKK